MSKKLANLYTLTKSRWDKGQFVFVEGKDGTLFSQGTYPTKVTVGDLPDWYVYGRYYKHFGYLSAAGVKHLLYVPNKFTNHMFKDDFLYISYDKPIVPNPDREQTFYKYVGFDEYIYGGVIVDFLLAAERFSGYDISCIKEQIEEKRQWFKTTHPDSYKWENPKDKPYFEDVGRQE